MLRPRCSLAHNRYRSTKNRASPLFAAFPPHMARASHLLRRYSMARYRSLLEMLQPCYTLLCLYAVSNEAIGTANGLQYGPSITTSTNDTTSPSVTSIKIPAPGSIVVSLSILIDGTCMSAWLTSSLHSKKNTPMRNLSEPLSPRVPSSGTILYVISWRTSTAAEHVDSAAASVAAALSIVATGSCELIVTRISPMLPDPSSHASTKMGSCASTSGRLEADACWNG